MEARRIKDTRGALVEITGRGPTSVGIGRAQRASRADGRDRTTPQAIAAPSSTSLRVMALQTCCCGRDLRSWQRFSWGLETDCQDARHGQPCRCGSATDRFRNRRAYAAPGSESSGIRCTNRSVPARKSDIVEGNVFHALRRVLGRRLRAGHGRILISATSDRFLVVLAVISRVVGLAGHLAKEVRNSLAHEIS